MTRAGVALVAVLLISAMTAEAQELEPRAYANSPIGLNFLILGYGYTKGDVALDSSAPIEDGKITVNSVVLAYARSLDVFGRTAKLDVVLPYAWLSGSATVAGKPVDREVSGLGDPQARFSFLFYGAPALPLEEFVDYQPDLILGASFAVTAPSPRRSGRSRSSWPRAPPSTPTTTIFSEARSSSAIRSTPCRGT